MDSKKEIDEKSSPENPFTQTEEFNFPTMDNKKSSPMKSFPRTDGFDFQVFPRSSRYEQPHERKRERERSPPYHQPHYFKRTWNEYESGGKGKGKGMGKRPRYSDETETQLLDLQLEVKTLSHQVKQYDGVIGKINETVLLLQTEMEKMKTFMAVVHAASSN
jgi:hypothetical protein